MHIPILLPSSDKHSSSTGSEKKFITKRHCKRPKKKRERKKNITLEKHHKHQSHPKKWLGHYGGNLGEVVNHVMGGFENGFKVFLGKGYWNFLSVL
jgi:hypothetical protein